MVVAVTFLLIVAAIVLSNRHDGPGRTGGWRWFFAWTGVGALFTLTYLTGLSIGLFLLPVAAAVFYFVARRSVLWAERIGFVEGVGAMFLLVAFLNRECTPRGSGTLVLRPGETSASSCGGFDPAPWFGVGALLSLGAVATYAFVRGRRTRGAEP